MIAFDDVNNALEYDKNTGLLRWKENRYGGFHGSVLTCKKGEIAGHIRQDKRVVIRLGKKLYLGHRLAWFISYGKWPDGEIDHMNGNPNDNRIDNLREATRTLNQENIRKAVKNKKSSEYLGVFLDKRKKEGNKRWKSIIQVSGKCISLGYFRTPEEAYASYITAKRLLHKGCMI